ncbi:MAG: class II fumarate hydratase [Spirochaetia bacterium]
MTEKYRTEHDSLGEVRVPESAYWGAQTQRAADNFAVSGLRIHPAMIEALAAIKECAALVNGDLDLIPPDTAEGIQQACREIREGSLRDQFPVDVFQTGSGTSWNMNINEVTARRAGEIIGRADIHPNDHVNRSQSSNDVIPSALSISARVKSADLIAALEQLKLILEKKAEQFTGVIKLGRTHLQDAVPMTGKDEFSGWAHQVYKSVKRVESALPDLEELPLGGTAVGTGLNGHPDFGRMVCRKLAERTGHPFRQAGNLFAGISARDPHLFLMGALNSTAAVLTKIAQDFRLLASGPRGGFGELILPALQPGSSIMPGKVNPVIPEMVIQAAAFVSGKYYSVTTACKNGPLQLNIMLPLISHEILTSLDLLTATARRFTETCAAGAEYDRERCRETVEKSLALVTPLALRIGYDAAAKTALRAYREGKTLREIIAEEGLLSEEEAGEVLDPRNMLGEPDQYP